MQSLTSKFARVHQKGSALGVANSFAYFGTFVGGVFGGFVIKHYSFEILVYGLVGVSIVWALITLSMQNPAKLKNLYLPKDAVQYEKIALIEGVVEYYTNECEALVIIKYNSDLINEEKLKSIIT